MVWYNFKDLSISSFRFFAKAGARSKPQTQVCLIDTLRTTSQSFDRSSGSMVVLLDQWPWNLRPMRDPIRTNGCSRRMAFR